MKTGSFLGRIEINLDQFKRNLEAIKKMIGKTKICLSVKGDAYGHGMAPIAKVAEEFGVEMISVSNLDEGIELRKAGIRCPIAVLGAIDDSRISQYFDHNLDFSVSSKKKAETVMSHSNGKSSRIHLEVDIGLHRTGVRPQTALELISYVKSQKNLNLVGVYSHLPLENNAPNPITEKQIQEFADLKSKVNDPNILWHLTELGGSYSYPNSYFDMVRPTLLSLGITPNGDMNQNVKPILSLKAAISFFKVVESGVGIGYGYRYKTSGKSRIVTIGIGFGDGYSSPVDGQFYVLFNGKKYPIVAIASDQIMVNIGNDEAFVGETVTLIGFEGENEINVQDLAKGASCSVAEYLSRIGNRLPKVYL